MGTAAYAGNISKLTPNTWYRCNKLSRQDQIRTAVRRMVTAQSGRRKQHLSAGSFRNIMVLQIATGLDKSHRQTDDSYRSCPRDKRI